MNKTIASIMILTAGAFWGIIGVFAREFTAMGLSSSDVVTIRPMSGAIMIGLYMLFFKPKYFRIKLKDLWCFIGTGIIGLYGFNLCYLKTVEVSSLAVGAVLLYTAPIFVVLLSAVIFKEKITTKKIIALVMAVVGCALVSGVLNQSGGLKGTALVIGIGAGFGYALYTVFTRFAINKGYSPVTIQFYTFVLSVVVSSFFVNWSKAWDIVSGEGKIHFGILFVLAGLLTTVLPNLLYNTGLKYVENGKAAVIASVEPVVAALCGFFIYSEVPTTESLIGIILVILAIIILNINKKEQK